MTRGRRFSLCKAIDLEIVLLHKVVHNHDKTFSSSSVQDCSLHADASYYFSLLVKPLYFEQQWKSNKVYKQAQPGSKDLSSSGTGSLEQKPWKPGCIGCI